MGGEDIINLDSSSDEEDASQLQNIQNTHPEERDGIQELGLNEIEPGDDPNEQDMDLGDDLVVANQSLLHHTAQLVATGPTPSTVINSSTDKTCILFCGLCISLDVFIYLYSQGLVSLSLFLIFPNYLSDSY